MAGSPIPTRVLDLSRPNADLWREMRKSYHALIHRGEDRWTVSVADSTAGLRSLYALRSDLPQLSDAHWGCVDRMHDAGVFRIYEASDSTGTIAGAIGVYIWKKWAYYGSGRSRADCSGVSHLLQWRVIQSLRSEGWPHYETGWMARDGDSDKSKQIAHFKAGFGGEQWWIPVL